MIAAIGAKPSFQSFRVTNCVPGVADPGATANPGATDLEWPTPVRRTGPPLGRGHVVLRPLRWPLR